MIAHPIVAALALTAVFTVNLAYAQVNRCQDASGKVIYSDKPCASGHRGDRSSGPRLRTKFTASASRPMRPRIESKSAPLPRSNAKHSNKAAPSFRINKPQLFVTQAMTGLLAKHWKTPPHPLGALPTTGESGTARPKLNAHEYAKKRLAGALLKRSALGLQQRQSQSLLPSPAVMDTTAMTIRAARTTERLGIVI